MDCGISMIGQLVNTDGKFMSFVEFKRKCSAVTHTQNFDVRRGIESTQRIPEAKEIVLTDRIEQYQTKAWLSVEKGNKTVQSLIAGSETSNCS